jgi:polar amino acid transport system substrate-binding protein
MQKQNNQTLIIIASLAAVLLICVLGIWLYSALFGGRAPEPVPTAPTEIISTPVGTDQVWARIQASGKMVVGTSADYPPFEYYNASYQIDGYDIALIRAIAQRLGVQAEVQDYAFDGLGGALQIGQIDVAVAAVSITPERQAQVDFSNVYYASQDGILAAQNSPITTITSVDAMAPYRVGVQAGSVYETWLRTSLVDTGKMLAGNLLSYPRIDSALADLKAGRINLVVLDLIPAQTYVSQGGLKLVGQGLAPQNYAIAMRKGETSLQAQINNALVQLQSDGTLAALDNQYGLTTPPIGVLPTPTPGPATTPPPQGCVDGMTLVQVLNLNDYNMTAPPVLPPGQPFTKGWRILNSGTCTWTSVYELVYVQGNTPEAKMGGQPTPIKGQVLPNQTYDLYISLVAPLAPGTYQGVWQMINGNAIAFGQRLNVGITVLAAPTSTPRPTQTSAPNISFSADKTVVNAGQPVVFTWSVQGAQATYFYQQGQAWQQYPVPPQSTATVYPAQTTTYELRVVFPSGTSEVRQITIQVNQVPGAPVIYRFTAEPANIYTGQCVNLQWQVQGTVNRVNLLRDGTELWGGAPLSGTLQDCPPGSGQVTYTIEATGPGGTSRLQRIVTVTQPTAPPPKPTDTTVPVPIINQFTATPSQIQAGGCVTVAWSVSGGVNNVRILRNGILVLDNAPFNGQEQDCLNQSGTVVYLLQASNTAGQTASQNATVTVAEAPPPSPLPGSAWTLLYYFDGVGAQVSVLTGTEINLTFLDASKVTGLAGCNTYNASYQTSGSSIRFDITSATKKTCDTPAGIMQQESQYLGDLAASASYQIVGSSQLEFYNASGQRLLVFQNMASPK